MFSLHIDVIAMVTLTGIAILDGKTLYPCMQVYVSISAKGTDIFGGVLDDL